ncbi:hypothetical protein [Polyangium sp. y55x31]|uniref:hypothetical protein n=1 Tax=Polyangium sp. y55x31 TaxID=3042688 RepID=UPI0024823A16|nr:hypothetical protein [Polyangium sp. y55x31]MDI1480337.1 hypothetical protein [Polyangium sp. y55x31]
MKVSPQQDAGVPKILVLVDGPISYSMDANARFSVHTALEALETDLTAPVKITRAHRQTDPYADRRDPPPIARFRFDDPGFDIDAYDQVWFFGFLRQADGPQASLSDAEIEILFAWMERGGGVLAMGDHENLGEALCGRIPRVRSMRKWKFDPGSVSPDNAPPIDGPNRHDTLVKGNSYIDGRGRDQGRLYTFDDESDDQPMKLEVPEPHPLLTTRDGGTIDRFPDHPHEGEVVVPKDLTQRAGFGGKSLEYPERDGERVAPVIVAWARVLDDHTDESDINKYRANPKSFGAVGAYDGHLAGVGRVVVDSTWHHWFDINLVGLPRNLPLTSGDKRKHNGFLDTESGREHLDRIKQYFLNVAHWLSPPRKQAAMSARALWTALRSYPLVEELSPRMTAEEMGRATLAAMPYLPGRSGATRWLTGLIPELKISALKAAPGLDDEAALVGAVVKQMLGESPERRFSRDVPSDDRLAALVAEGATAGSDVLETKSASGLAAAVKACLPRKS